MPFTTAPSTVDMATQEPHGLDLSQAGKKDLRVVRNPKTGKKFQVRRGSERDRNAVLGLSLRSSSGRGWLKPQTGKDSHPRQSTSRGTRPKEEVSLVDNQSRGVDLAPLSVASVEEQEVTESGIKTSDGQDESDERGSENGTDKGIVEGIVEAGGVGGSESHEESSEGSQEGIMELSDTEDTTALSPGTIDDACEFQSRCFQHSLFIRLTAVLNKQWTCLDSLSRALRVSQRTCLTLYHRWRLHSSGGVAIRPRAS